MVFHKAQCLDLCFIAHILVRTEITTTEWITIKFGTGNQDLERLSLHLFLLVRSRTITISFKKSVEPLYYIFGPLSQMK